MLHRICIYGHTAGSDTIFIQIYMDAPPGVPGVSKELEGHKDQNETVSLNNSIQFVIVPLFAE